MQDSLSLRRQKVQVWVRRIAYLLDESVPLPGTKYRIGIDPILGLLPGVGDLLSLLLSLSIIVLALFCRLSFWTLLRMLANVALEALVGLVPVLGDAFDFVWKANVRNRELLLLALEQEARAKKDKRFVLLTSTLTILSISCLIGLVGYGLWLLMVWLLQMLTGLMA